MILLPVVVIGCLEYINVQANSSKPWVLCNAGNTHRFDHCCHGCDFLTAETLPEGCHRHTFSTLDIFQYLSGSGPSASCEKKSVTSKYTALCRDGGIFSPLRLRWVKGVCVFRCNLPPALLAEWPGSFTCHCGNTGLERTPRKSQHTKLTLEKKILPPLLPGFELATFRPRARRCYQQAILASVWQYNVDIGIGHHFPWRLPSVNQ